MTTTDTAAPPTETRYARIVRKKIEAGLCRDCGKPRGEDGNANRCAGCAEKRRLYQKNRRAALRLEAAAGPLAVALGDTAPRLVKPAASAPAGDSMALGVGGLSLHLETKPSAAPSASVNPEQPWGTDHWRCALYVMSREGRRQGYLLTTITTGPGFGGRAPELRELLALLFVDAADAGRPFAEWCAVVGLSTDSVRAKRSHEAARGHASALRRLLGRHRAALEARVLLGVEPTTKKKAARKAAKKGKAKR